MNKKEMEEFLNKINAKKKEVKDLVDAGKLEEAKKAKAELIEMQDKFNLLMDLDEDDLDDIKDKVQEGTAKQVGEVKDKKSIVKSFVNIANRYPYDIDLRVGRHVVDGKSILGIFSLDLSKPITLEVYSDHCDDLLEELKPYIIG